ncbi:hypothetical protein AX16_009074 [Volvariella volvacea WC 439]|nr:hypothetical protein AX16_009074 [Volvariella volvacea WC 439]
MARLALVVLLFFSSIYSVLAQSVTAGLSWNYLSTSNSVKFAYLDSGSRQKSSTYTTLVFVHGDGFNAGVYTNLLPIASDYGFRIVALNRRDYPPTTALSAAELAPLSQGVAGELAFFRERGKELGLFLDAFIQKNNIPAARSDRTGGIVLVGWSLGCMFTHAFLANPDVFTSTILARLNKYVHTVVQHDAGPAQMGFSNPPEYDISLWLEPDLKKRFSLFRDWATGYYRHQNANPVTGNTSTIEFNTPTSQPHTLSKLSPQQLSLLTDFNAFAGSETTLVFMGPDSLKEIMRRALFDPALASVLPNTRVRYYHGGTTPGILVYATWLLEDCAADPFPVYGGKKARDVQVTRSPSGNHFIFYDQPGTALEEFRRAINA